MYDVDDSGSINIMEMTSIISTMDELEGEGGRLGKDSPSARYIIQSIISTMDELEGEEGQAGQGLTLSQVYNTNHHLHHG